jgi:uncharacterized membrane protein
MDMIKSKTRHAFLFWVVAGYLVLSLAYGFLVPAWEANDEMDHVANIEFILQENRLVPLRLPPWHETHQPPLYYLLAAGWQRLLGLSAFTPAEPTRTTGMMTAPTLQLAYVHSTFTPEQRAAAGTVHKLRLFSTLIGLATVLLTYAAALCIVQRTDVAASAAAFVAFLPKFTVISAAVSNDSLVVMLCSLGLSLIVLYETSGAKLRVRAALSFAFGLTAGAAIITKLNSLPVFCFLLMALLILPANSHLERVRTAILSVAGCLASSGWWLAHNFFSGSGWLGQKGAEQWLNERLPGLIARVPWTDQERFLNYVPSQLFQSIWYNGGWNQFVLPFAINLVFTLVSAVCCFGALKAVLRGGMTIRKLDRKVLILMGCCLMALAAVFIIARSTTQGEGRVAYVGLSAFAILTVLGTGEIFGWGRSRIPFAIWPALLLGLQTYVFLRFVMPFAAF